MAYCENCGHKLNEGELFCSECGTPVPTLAMDDSSKQPIEKSVSSVSAATTRLTNKSANKFDFKKYKKPIIITLGLLGGIVLVGAGYIVITGQNPLEQVMNTGNSGGTTSVVFNQKSGDTASNDSTANSEDGQTSGNVVVFNQKSSEQVSESASVESNEATSSAQAVVFNKQSTTQSSVEGSESGSETTQSSESTSQTAIVLNKAASTSETDQAGTASEGVSEKPSATLKRKTIDPRVDLTAIQSAYDTTLGAISGNHSFYFQEITDAIGEHVSGEPLVVNDTPIRSASTIKVFVLGAFFDQVAKGNLSYDTNYTVTSAVGGTGVVQYNIGSTYTLFELAVLMITDSDNEAMNILVDQMGGIDVVNQFINDLGYSQSRLNRKMLDMAALSQGIDNYISAREVGDYLKRIYYKEIVSEEASNAMLEIMSAQKDHDYLVAQLSGVTTYNKTGKFDDYGVRNDVAIVATPKGAFVMVGLSDGAGDVYAKASALQDLGYAVNDVFIK